MTKQSQQLILMLIIGALIGFGSFKALNAPASPASDDTNTTPAGVTPADVADVTKGRESLSGSHRFPLPPSVPANVRTGLNVADQPAAHTVFVTGLEIATTSWVAIYDNREAAPGSILGAQKVKVGDTTATVELLRPEGTMKGMSYYAAILPDDGDGQFNRLTDLPPFSPDKLVMVSFFAQ